MLRTCDLKNNNLHLSAFIDLGIKISERKSDWEIWALEVKQKNPWFTEENIFSALDAIVFMLQEEKLLIK